MVPSILQGSGSLSCLAHMRLYIAAREMVCNGHGLVSGLGSTTSVWPVPDTMPSIKDLCVCLHEHMCVCTCAHMEASSRHWTLKTWSYRHL